MFNTMTVDHVLEYILQRNAHQCPFLFLEEINFVRTEIFEVVTRYVEQVDGVGTELGIA